MNEFIKSLAESLALIGFLCIITSILWTLVLFFSSLDWKTTLAGAAGWIHPITTLIMIIIFIFTRRDKMKYPTLLFVFGSVLIGFGMFGSNIQIPKGIIQIIPTIILPYTSTTVPTSSYSSPPEITEEKQPNEEPTEATNSQTENLSWRPCPGTYLSRLQVGNLAYVSYEPPLANHVRERPNGNSTILGSLQPGETMEIIGGPSCSNQWIWWQVSSLEKSMVGWTSEGDDQDYWLVPMDNDDGNSAISKPSGQYSASPEQFIRDYYTAVTNRQYDLTWSLLSDKFKRTMNGPEKGGFQGYVDWWNTVEYVEILEATVKSQTDSRASVFVKALYHYSNGTTVPNSRAYSLIMDFSRNTWLFDLP